MNNPPTSTNNSTSRPAAKITASITPALSVVGIYLVVGGVWVLLSDQILAAIVPDRDTRDALQTYKSWFFVVATALLLFLLVKRSIESTVRVKEELAASELRYRSLAEQVTSITYISALDRENSNLYISTQTTRILGFTPEDWLANPRLWEERLYPQDKERMLSAFNDFQHRGVPFSAEYRFIAKDGRVVWLHDEAAVVTDADSKRLFIQGVMVDITASKQIEEELQHERDFISAVLDTAGGLVVVLDREGRIVRFNPACEHTSGYSAHEVIGKIFWKILLPADEIPAMSIEFTKLQGGQLLNEFTNHWITKSGELRLIQFANTVMLDDKGTVEFIVATGIDITERRRVEQTLIESERKYRLLMEQASDGIVILDNKGYITDVNTKACQMTGYDHEEMIGLDSRRLLSRQDLKERPFNLQDLEAGFEIITERQIIRKDGTTLPVEISAKHVNDQTQGFIRDVTQRKQYEKNLETHAAEQARLLRELLTAQEAERKRLSMEIHDGPLQSLGVSLLALDRVMRRDERGEQEQARHELQELRRMLAGTVGEVRAVLADLSLDLLTQYGLLPALRDHIERFSWATGIEVEMTTTLTERLPSNIEMLVYRLAQEALSNVRKHADTQKADVFIGTEDHLLMLRVADEGKGFNTGALGDPDAPLRPGEQLGLRSMRERVRNANGTLEVNSAAGKGTTITFRIPYAEC